MSSWTGAKTPDQERVRLLRQQLAFLWPESEQPPKDLFKELSLEVIEGDENAYLTRDCITLELLELTIKCEKVCFWDKHNDAILPSRFFKCGENCEVWLRTRDCQYYCKLSVDKNNIIRKSHDAITDRIKG